MPATVEIKNADRLLKKLTQIPEAMREKIRDAMSDEADEIVSLMKRLAPPHIAPTIAWRWGAKAPKGSMAIGTVEVPSGPNGSVLTLTIYATEWTAKWFEFGTADRFHKSGKYVGKIDKHPFFFPSYRAKRKSAKRRVQAAVRAAARLVAAGG